MYSEKVVEHFKHPKNLGELKDADGIGEVGNMVCGDVMRLYIKIDKKTGTIKRIRFKTLGCAAAIATSSMITELAKGKKIEDALKISRNDVAGELGGLPPIKMHCSNLAADALHEAVYDYYKKNGKEISKEMEEEHQKIVLHNKMEQECKTEKEGGHKH